MPIESDKSGTSARAADESNTIMPVVDFSRALPDTNNNTNNNNASAFTDKFNDNFETVVRAADEETTMQVGNITDKSVESDKSSAVIRAADEGSTMRVGDVGAFSVESEKSKTGVSVADGIRTLPLGDVCAGPVESDSAKTVAVRAADDEPTMQVGDINDKSVELKKSKAVIRATEEASPMRVGEVSALSVKSEDFIRTEGRAADGTRAVCVEDVSALSVESDKSKTVIVSAADRGSGMQERKVEVVKSKTDVRAVDEANIMPLADAGALHVESEKLKPAVKGADEASAMRVGDNSALVVDSEKSKTVARRVDVDETSTRPHVDGFGLLVKKIEEKSKTVVSAADEASAMRVGDGSVLVVELEKARTVAKRMDVDDASTMPLRDVSGLLVKADKSSAMHLGEVSALADQSDRLKTVGAAEDKEDEDEDGEGEGGDSHVFEDEGRHAREKRGGEGEKANEGGDKSRLLGEERGYESDDREHEGGEDGVERDTKDIEKEDQRENREGDRDDEGGEGDHFRKDEKRNVSGMDGVDEAEEEVHDMARCVGESREGGGDHRHERDGGQGEEKANDEVRLEKAIEEVEQDHQCEEGEVEMLWSVRAEADGKASYLVVFKGYEGCHWISEADCDIPDLIAQYNGRNERTRRTFSSLVEAESDWTINVNPESPDTFSEQLHWLLVDGYGCSDVTPTTARFKVQKGPLIVAYRTCETSQQIVLHGEGKLDFIVDYLMPLVLSARVPYKVVNNSHPSPEESHSPQKIRRSSSLSGNKPICAHTQDTGGDTSSSVAKSSAGSISRTTSSSSCSSSTNAHLGERKVSKRKIVVDDEDGVMTNVSDDRPLPAKKPSPDDAATSSHRDATVNDDSSRGDISRSQHHSKNRPGNTVSGLRQTTSLGKNGSSASAVSSRPLPHGNGPQTQSSGDAVSSRNSVWPGLMVGNTSSDKVLRQTSSKPSSSKNGVLPEKTTESATVKNAVSESVNRGTSRPAFDARGASALGKKRDVSQVDSSSDRGTRDREEPVQKRRNLSSSAHGVPLADRPRAVSYANNEPASSSEGGPHMKVTQRLSQASSGHARPSQHHGHQHTRPNVVVPRATSPSVVPQRPLPLALSSQQPSSGSAIRSRTPLPKIPKKSTARMSG